MKERIVIEGKEPKEVIIKLVKASSIKMYEELERTDRICIYGEELKRIKVPETFEELKELCKGIKEKLNKEIWEIKIEDEFIYVSKKWETKEICFTSVGNMVSNNGWDLLMTNLTPARQWQIIKSLIGEE